MLPRPHGLPLTRIKGRDAGPSVQTLFAVLPKAILGVILFLTGAQLALGSCDFSKNKGERFVTLVTAAFCLLRRNAAAEFHRCACRGRFSGRRMIRGLA